MDALSQALGNAAQNSRNNNDTLYVENLDDIGVSVESEVGLTPEEWERFAKSREARLVNLGSLDPDPNYPPYVVVPKPPDYNPDDVAFKHSEAYQRLMANEYEESAKNNPTLANIQLSINHLSVLVQVVKDDVQHIVTIIQQAASTMPSEPDHKHRSLHEWDDNYLINELVERENSLMPFYFELLKRISPDLQSYVQESMNGKYQSLSVLSKLCAALSYGKTQPVPPQETAQESPLYSKVQRQKEVTLLLNQNLLTEEQQNAMSRDEYSKYAAYMNELCKEAGLMARFPTTKEDRAIQQNSEPTYPAAVSRSYQEPARLFQSLPHKW